MVRECYEATAPVEFRLIQTQLRQVILSDLYTSQIYTVVEEQHRIGLLMIYT